MAETVKKSTTTKAPAKKAAPKKTAAKATAPKSAKVTVVKDKNAAKTSFKATLPAKLFASEKIYEQAIFDSILSERASRRQGTHKVKNRAEVSGSGKKPWRQKGTGRARTSSLRTPVFVGGGRAFGPTPNRNYSLKVNRKVKLAAFVSALTLLAKDNAVIVDDLALDTISTKAMAAKLAELKVNNFKNVLVVTENETVFKSAKNIPNVVLSKANSLTVERIIGADVMVISNESLKLLEGKVK
ncbi:50S ribosomal protein L4 [Mycoplasma seminis]|uniref:Large ribosomal subunit protein uL4 n=1 Tax=Mycoplasma seminis TaxID=512749 RepID=A0ABY9HB94_9MOLU|nr:50S ribosomal protein L4 [Mycoplasma seminis]WLP85455.1 50S ribosomal protein L4 [Mycoplasma seminis]